MTAFTMFSSESLIGFHLSLYEMTYQSVAQNAEQERHRIGVDDWSIWL